MKPDIYRVKDIGSGFLAVMAKPVSGEWVEEEFSGLSNEGIINIVSLLESHEMYEVGLQNEKELTEKNGMNFYSLPIKDRGLPESISEFRSFTKKIYNEVNEGNSTVIHCRAGIGRTGIVAASVLMHHGFEASEAFSLISLKRGVQVPDTEEQIQWVASNSNELSKNT